MQEKKSSDNSACKCDDDIIALVRFWMPNILYCQREILKLKFHFQIIYIFVLRGPLTLVTNSCCDIHKSLRSVNKKIKNKKN